MTEKNEALRLADALEHDPLKWCDEAAAELRRLYMVDKLYRAALEGRNVMHLELHKANAERGILQAQRDALLEALKGLMQQYKDQPECFMDWSKARAAIAKAEGGQ